MRILCVTCPEKLIIDDKVIKDLILELYEPGDEIEPQNMNLNSPHFHHLEIRNGMDKLVIMGAVIDVLDLNRGPKTLVINNCCIGKIFFSSKLDGGVIHNSWIGQFNLFPSSFVNLMVRGGWICAINGPATHENNPFSGTIEIENVKLPTSRHKSLLFKGAQQYRNLRVHFEELQNGPMAGLMRAKELASDREGDSGASKFFSWIYCIVSVYGRKPGRAFIWALVFLVINIVILTCTDGVRVDSSNLSKGAWQLEWQGDNFRSQFGRASILTFQTVINPFTIFVAKSAFKFNSLWGTIHSFFFVLLSDAAFVFGSLAIRKRLKYS